MNALTRPTLLLDFEHPALQALIRTRGWAALLLFERIGAVYAFVRDEIAFATTRRTTCPPRPCWLTATASANQGHAADGPAARRGRALPIPRLHHRQGAAARRDHRSGLCAGTAQRHPQLGGGRVRGPLGQPRGFILDAPYLTALQRRFAGHSGPFAASVRPRPTCRRRASTGAGRTPTSSATASTTTSGCSTRRTTSMRGTAPTSPAPKRWLYQHLVRHLMNGNVARLRRGD